MLYVLIAAVIIWFIVDESRTGESGAKRSGFPVPTSQKVYTNVAAQAPQNGTKKRTDAKLEHILNGTAPQNTERVETQKRIPEISMGKARMDRPHTDEEILIINEDRRAFKRMKSDDYRKEQEKYN